MDTHSASCDIRLWLLTGALIAAGIVLTAGAAGAAGSGGYSSVGTTPAADISGARGAISPAGDMLTTKDTSVSAQDIAFVQEALRWGQTAAALSETAMDRAARDEVQDFAYQIIRDQSTLGRQLRGIAASDHIRWSGAMLHNDYGLLIRLRGLSGASFDRAYVAGMLTRTRSQVHVLQAEVNTGENSAIRRWAAESLARAQHHVRMAEQMSPHGSYIQHVRLSKQQHWSEYGPKFTSSAVTRGTDSH